MALQQLTQTPSFTINFDDAFPSARRRGDAIAATCERDTEIIASWFGVHSPLGQDNRATVNIVPNDGLGDNYGYADLFHGTLIEINPLEGAPDQDVADNFARAIFVAELAEVFMSIRNNSLGHTTWDAGDSAGEALSAICGEMLYGDACLRFGQGYPRGQFWLQTSDWPDFVSKIDGTDRHFVSFGCGILFISFLIGQLGIPLNRIIQAEGRTLEDKFTSLTGATGGYTQLTSVLGDFFARPAGRGDLRTDFPFPLLDNASRVVTVMAERNPESSTETGDGTATLSLPFPCRGTVEARYVLVDTAWHLRFSAMPLGFAHPVYTWRLRSANGGLPTTIPDAGLETTVSWAAEPVDPAHPTTTRMVPTPVDIDVRVDGPRTVGFGDAQYDYGLLDLHVPAGVGSVWCTVECEVRDAVSPGTTSTVSLVGVSTRTARFDETYSDEVTACRDKAASLLNQRVKPDLLHQIMPDPPLDLRAAISVIRAVAARVAEAVQSGDKDTAVLLTGLATDQLGIPASFLTTRFQSRP